MKRLVFVAAVLLFSTGCASFALPDRPKGSMLRQIDQTKFDAVVAVHAKGQFSASMFAEELRETNLFEDVVLGSEYGGVPDLVVTVVDTDDGSGAIIPIFSLLTLWVIPTWFDDPYGDAFEFSLPNGGDVDYEVVELDSRYVGTSVMGFVSALINVLPNRGFREPRSTRRFTQALSAVIVEKAPEIEKLIVFSKAGDVGSLAEPTQRRP